jgi:hypothetical protein
LRGAQAIKDSAHRPAISAGIRSRSIIHRPSYWCHPFTPRGAFRRGLFQRRNRAVARGNLSLSRIGPRIGSLPAHTFQAAPAD